MKAIARVVSTAFWEDPKVVNDFTPEDKYFMLYLLTNPNTSQLGIYEFVPRKAALELGYSVDAVNALLERFECKHCIIKYSKETSEIAIKNYLKYSVVKGGKPVMDCLLKDESMVKDKSLLSYVYENLINSDGMVNTVNEFLDYLGNKYGIHSNHDNDNDNDIDNDNDNERYVPCDFLRLKEFVISRRGQENPTGIFECEWCGNHVDVLENHHFPMPKRLGGKETVSICHKCHKMFHDMEYAERMGSYSSAPKDTSNNDETINDTFEQLWKLYPRKLGKGSIKPATKKRIYNIGFEQMKKCIDRYKEYIKGKDEQYVMYGSTFFNSGYVDYLDENYQTETNNDDYETAEGWE